MSYRESKDYKRAMEGIGKLTRIIESTMDFIIQSRDEAQIKNAIAGLNILVDKVNPILDMLVSDKRLIPR